VAQSGYWVDTAQHVAGRLDIERRDLDRVEVANGNLYCARHVDDEETFTYRETWIIPDKCWTLSRFTFREDFRPDLDFWKIEPDPAVLDGLVWRVADGFLDINLFEGSHYHLEDADEFADALATGELSSSAAVEILNALDALCRELLANGYSGEKILSRYAPGLPQ
jgi:hypothetical protein